MSEEAFKDSKINALQNENMQLQSVVAQWSANLRAREQVGNELFSANINLRTTHFLHEDKIAKLTNDIKSFVERVEALEKEKAALIEEKSALEAKLNDLKVIPLMSNELIDLANSPLDVNAAVSNGDSV